MVLKKPLAPSYVLPEGHDRLLLLSCCAPCSGGIIRDLKASAIDTRVLFYNPNIHPKAEYLKRKHENKRYTLSQGFKFVDLDYDPENWFARIKGFEDEPERGQRCAECFLMRLERAALYAAENGYTLFSSTLGVSRHKDMDQVNRAGNKAAAHHDDLEYWDINWRKCGGMTSMRDVANAESFYRQAYCGCIPSLDAMEEIKAKAAQ